MESAEAASDTVLKLAEAAGRGINMNKYVYKIIMAVFVLAFLLPIQVFAQSNDSFELDPQGNVTLKSSHAAGEGISSLQFSLTIESESAYKVEFQFSPNIAQVAEFRYHEDTGTLNVYIAGTEALFAENTESLMIGKVVVLDASQNSIPAKVSIDSDSLQYVYGTESRKAEEVQVPEKPVEINVSSADSGGSQKPPTEDTPQGPGGSSSDSQGSDNSNNGTQGSDNSNNSSQGSGNSNNSSQGSDNSNNTQSQGNGNPSGNTTSNSHNTASSSQNTASGTQSSGANTSNGQSQGTDSGETGSTSQAENYTHLKKTIENARGFKEEDYSSESYEALQAAITKAEAVLGDPYATPEEVDEALIELENAIGALVNREEGADDSQQSGEQESGETSEQIGGAGTEEGDVLNESKFPTLLMVAGILVLAGCLAAVVIIKIKNEQSYEDD